MTLKCVVPGCKAECQTFYRFPSPRTRSAEFKRWLELLHMDALYALSPQKVYTIKRICAAHFDASCKNPGSPRLHANAVPTIGLPGNRFDNGAALYPRRHIIRQSFQQRLAAAARYASLPRMKKLCVTTSAEKFFLKQIPKRKKPAARQFTLDEKKQCLSLLQNYPQSYHLLQQIFILPCKQTLVNYLSQMSLNCGMNEHLFNALKSDVKRLKAKDKFCVVMFDEMRLQAQLSYNKEEDRVEGFVDNGRERSTLLADRALVFMARGIRRSWKQAVAFTFSKGAVTSAELVEQLSAVLDSLFAIGLRPIATVCDQTRTNVSAVNSLLRATEESYRRRAVPWRGEFFTVRNKKIFPLYDMPHLLKAVRNHLLSSKVLRFTENNSTMEARWEHVVALYESDKEDPGFSLLSHAHIFPTKLQRNRVILCSQVFSQRIAAIMHWLGKYPPLGQPAPQTHGTAKLLLFFDNLFDSVNSGSFNVPELKQLRAPLTKTSTHLEFWHEAVRVLSSMQFIDPRTKQVDSHPRTVTNWIATLRGLHWLWLNLQMNDFKYLQVRNCNQDALENFFASIRCRGQRNVNPTCASFIGAFKTVTLNGFPASECADVNCEERECEKALSTREELFAASENCVEPLNGFACGMVDIFREELATNKSSDCEKEIAANSSFNCEKLATNISSDCEKETSYYCSKFVMKQLRPVFKKCTVCNTDLFAQVTHNNMVKTKLKYVSYSCATAIAMVKKLVQQLIPKYCSHSNLCTTIATFVQANVDLTFLTCPVHKERIKEILIKKTVELILHRWIKDVNRILNGQNLRGSAEDDVKKQAMMYYKTKYKNK